MPSSALPIISILLIIVPSPTHPNVKALISFPSPMRVWAYRSCCMRIAWQFRQRCQTYPIEGFGWYRQIGTPSARVKIGKKFFINPPVRGMRSSKCGVIVRTLQCSFNSDHAQNTIRHRCCCRSCWVRFKTHSAIELFCARCGCHKIKKTG